MAQVPTIFLSYVREDIEFVNRLRSELHEFGFAVWRDKESLQPAQDWKRAIDAGIKNSDVFAVLISRSSVQRESSQLIRECQVAQKLQNPLRNLLNHIPMAGRRSRKLVQLKIDSVDGQSVEKFFSELRLGKFNQTNRIDFHPSYEEGFTRLVGLAQIEATVNSRLKQPERHDSTIFGWRIENLPLYEVFDPPVTESDLVTKIQPAKPLPDILEKYFVENVDAQIEQIRRRNKSLTINKGYGGRKIIISKHQVDERPGRNNRPEIIFEDADYRHQVMFSNRLDSIGTLNINDTEISIKDYITKYVGIKFHNFSWDKMERIPFPQRFANVVSVIVKATNDADQLGLVVGLRTTQAAVNNSAQPVQTIPCTVSCAEGMLRPDDARPNGDPSPILTATRAMKEELGLVIEKDFKIEDVKLIGLAYDSERCQPIASHLVILPHLNISDVRERWRSAKDRNEHVSLELIPMMKPEFDLFMDNRWVHEGNYLSLFSNHQRFGAATVGKYFFDGEQNIKDPST